MTARSGTALGVTVLCVTLLGPVATGANAMADPAPDPHAPASSTPAPGGPAPSVPGPPTPGTPTPTVPVPPTPVPPAPGTPDPSVPPETPSPTEPAPVTTPSPPTPAPSVTAPVTPAPPPAASITLASAVPETARAPLQSAQVPPRDGTALTGTVADAAGAPIPRAPIRVTGSAGTYFSTSAGTPASPLTRSAGDDLTTRLSTAATAAGALPPVHAYFTRAGLNRITVTSGSASRTVLVVARGASAPYRVQVGSVAGNPTSRLVIIGMVLDAFGNPVPDVRSGLTLSTGHPSLGVLTSTTPATDASGMFSTSFTAAPGRRGRTALVVRLGSGEPGSATVTGAAHAAGLLGPQPDPAWKALAGLAIPPGTDQGRATITLARHAGFTASSTLIGGGKARLRGTAAPGTKVALYARPIGRARSRRIAIVTANREGNWGLGTTITTTTSFRARSRGQRSTVLTTVVRSYQVVMARALGQGLIRFSVAGVPNVPGEVTVDDASHQRLARVRTGTDGSVTTVVRATPGRTRFRIAFRARGTTVQARWLTGTVR